MEYIGLEDRGDVVRAKGNFNIIYSDILLYRVAHLSEVIYQAGSIPRVEPQPSFFLPMFLPEHCTRCLINFMVGFGLLELSWEGIHGSCTDSCKYL